MRHHHTRKGWPRKRTTHKRANLIDNYFDLDLPSFPEEFDLITDALLYGGGYLEGNGNG